MDRYLEDISVGEEFHHIFITESIYLLSDRLTDNYVGCFQANLITVPGSPMITADV